MHANPRSSASSPLPSLLLVESDAFELFRLHSELNRHGYSIEAFSNAVDAMSSLWNRIQYLSPQRFDDEGNLPDVLLFDYSENQGHGVWFLRSLRSARISRPVILMVESGEKFEAQPGTHVLEKPVKPSELLTLLKELAGQI